MEEVKEGQVTVQIAFDTWNLSDLSKVTVTAYDMLMPRAAEPPGRDAQRQPRVGWGSRPSSASTGGRKPPTAGSGNVSTSVKVLYPGDKTRPQFLVGILHYLKSEMRHLGADVAPAGDPRRLQVYREVFDRFIREFKTYEPLLSDVKREYDMALEAQQAELSKLYPSAGQLAVQRYQAAQEMDAARDESQRLLDAQIRSTHEAQHRSTVLESELESLRHQHEKLAEELRRRDARSEEYVSFKLAESAAALHTLERHRQEELRVKDVSISDLQRALRKAHEDMAGLAETIEKSRVKFAGSVAKGVYDAVVEERNVARLQCAELQREGDQRDAAVRRVEEERSLLLDSLKRAKDDRFPDWEYIESLCPSGIQQWEILCKDKDYNDSIILLIRELVRAQTAKGFSRGKDMDQMGYVESEERFFVGLGMTAAVPKHL
ncbi:Translin-associated factor X-interacting protein 1, partial [Thoreauomyces humboldtii]